MTGDGALDTQGAPLTSANTPISRSALIAVNHNQNVRLTGAAAARGFGVANVMCGPRSAALNAVADAKRSAGSLASAMYIASSIADGTVSRTVDGDTGRS